MRLNARRALVPPMDFRAAGVDLKKPSIVEYLMPNIQSGTFPDRGSSHAHRSLTLRIRGTCALLSVVALRRRARRRAWSSVLAGAGITTAAVGALEEGLRLVTNRLAQLRVSDAELA